MRKLGLILLAIAWLVLIWAVVTVVWQEPVTGVQHHREQERLEEELREYKPNPLNTLTKRPEGRAVARLSGAHVNAVIVSGRSPDSLKKGPGLWNNRPGQGRTTVISGHRTTYGAPFRHIDEFKRGDVLKLVAPEGTFRYRVTETRVVDPSDVWVTRNVGHEQLVLTACHPVYSAAQRIVVFADRTSL